MVINVANICNANNLENLNTIITRLQTAAGSEDSDAKAKLVDLQIDGFESNGKSREELRIYTEEAHASGSPFGAYVYGISVTGGMLGFEKNEEKGKAIVSKCIPELVKLAENGDSFACLYLYFIHKAGQSSEVARPEEAIKWLMKGRDLGNPILSFYLVEEILLSNANEEKTNQALSMLVGNFRYLPGIPQEKCTELYAAVVRTRLSQLDFKPITCAFRQDEVVGVFRNNFLKCNIILIYDYDPKSQKISGNPGIIVGLMDGECSPENWELTLARNNIYKYGTTDSSDSHSFLLDIRPLIKYSDKIFDWVNKVFENFPIAFNKPLNQDQSVIFCWDGIQSIDLILGRDKLPREDETVNLREALLLNDVYKLVANNDGDTHSFFKRTQQMVDEASKKSLNDQELINSNFN